ncbi:MAG: TolC family protein [Candidatus Omnitrophota bacterium]
MKRILKTYFCLQFVIVLALLVSNNLYAREDTQLEVLTLDEFIHQAIQKDTRFEEIMIEELKLKYKKALALPAADFVLGVKREYDFFFDPKGDSFEDTLSLSKLFPYTGTTIDAEYASSISESTRKKSSDFTAYITQPIAENAFGRNTRILDKIIGFETEVANFQIIEAYEDYLATVIQLYYNWYSAYENLKTATISYNENLKLLENIKEREKFKIALPVDVSKISLQVAAKKENLITLQNKYDENLTLIKESIRYSEEEIICPEKPAVYNDVSIDFAKDYEVFNINSRTSQMLLMLENKASLEVDKYADELLPSIDIIAGYSIEGSGRDIDKGNRTVYAGISMEWPLPGQVERAQYETSKVELQKTKLSSENIHLRLRSNLKNLNDKIQAENKLIALAQEKIDYARIIVDDDKENYSLGRISLNDFIDEVNKLEENKFNKIYHEIQLKRFIIEWLRLTDELVKKK